MRRQSKMTSNTALALHLDVTLATSITEVDTARRSELHGPVANLSSVACHWPGAHSRGSIPGGRGRQRLADSATNGQLADGHRGGPRRCRLTERQTRQLLHLSIALQWRHKMPHNWRRHCANGHCLTRHNRHHSRCGRSPARLSPASPRSRRWRRGWRSPASPRTRRWRRGWRGSGVGDASSYRGRRGYRRRPTTECAWETSLAIVDVVHVRRGCL